MQMDLAVCVLEQAKKPRRWTPYALNDRNNQSTDMLAALCEIKTNTAANAAKNELYHSESISFTEEVKGSGKSSSALDNLES